MIEHIFIGFSAIIVIATIAILTRIFMKCCVRRCESQVSMKGKTVVVTGGNAGLGYHTAKDLATRGGRIILACRNVERGNTARDKIIAETGNKNVVFKKLNLSSLNSVRAFAEDLKQTESRLDVLINNAGVHCEDNQLTEDGIVEGMQINYFAPFLLTLLLLPMLKESKGRIVNVSSLCHYRGEVNFDKINKTNSYNGTLTYANSKLCSTIFTKELSRRMEGKGVTVNAVHPGVILTNITNTASMSTKVLFGIWCWFCCRTAEEGAQTIIYLAVADEVGDVSGKYFVDCKQRFVLWTANDVKLAQELWDYSETLVGIRSVM